MILASGEGICAVMFLCGHLHFSGSPSGFLVTGHTRQVFPRSSASPSPDLALATALLGTCYSESQ